MESEDEMLMHDANDAESLDDEFYSGNGADSDDADITLDCDFIDNDSDDSDDLPYHYRSQVPKSLLLEWDTGKEQETSL